MTFIVLRFFHSHSLSITAKGNYYVPRSMFVWRSKITTQQPVDKISVCHCGMCQRWNGGPGFTIDCHDDVSIDGEAFISRFASSEWAERAFCKQCGTHLFYHLHTPSSYYVSSTLFEETKNASLAMQIFVDSKPVYYNFVEKTPMLTEQDIINLMSQQS